MNLRWNEFRLWLVISGLVKEDETKRLGHEHERALERLRSEMEREKYALQKQHAAELETTIEKTNNKLKKLGML